MSLFDEAVAMVLRFEGGETIDPDDPGRRTKFGLSSRAYPDLDFDTLTREDAVAIYREDYWERIWGDQLPGQVAIVLFDAAVNQGVAAAIRMVQREVGTVQDGIMGPKTLEAIQSRIHDDLAVAVAARRAVAYAQMPQRMFELYGFGWMRRVIDAYRTAVVHG